jgi:hypothetical protein
MSRVQCSVGLGKFVSAIFALARGVACYFHCKVCWYIEANNFFNDMPPSPHLCTCIQVSTEVASLGIRGTTVVTGSGDWGVGCSKDSTFRGDFPSSSPRGSRVVLEC